MNKFMNTAKLREFIRNKREDLVLRLSFRFGSELWRSLLGPARFFDLEFKGPVLWFLEYDLDGFNHSKMQDYIFSTLAGRDQWGHRNLTIQELSENLRNPAYEWSFESLTEDMDFMKVYSEVFKIRKQILKQERNALNESILSTSENELQLLQLKNLYSKRRRKIISIALSELDSKLKSCVNEKMNSLEEELRTTNALDSIDSRLSISKDLKHLLTSKTFRNDIKVAFMRHVSDYLSINLYAYIDFEEAWMLLPKRTWIYKYNFTFISIALWVRKICKSDLSKSDLIDELFNNFYVNYIKYYIEEFNKALNVKNTTNVLRIKKEKKIPIAAQAKNPSQGEKTTYILPKELEVFAQQILSKDPNSSFAKNLAKAYNRSKRFTVEALIDILSNYFDEVRVWSYIDLLDNYDMVSLNEETNSTNSMETEVKLSETQASNPFKLWTAIIDELHSLVAWNSKISNHHVVHYYKEAWFIFDNEDGFLSQCDAMSWVNMNPIYKKLLKYLLYPDSYSLKYYTHNHDKTKVYVMDLWNGNRIIFIRNDNQKHRVVMIGNHDLYMYHLNLIKKWLYV